LNSTNLFRLPKPKFCLTIESHFDIAPKNRTKKRKLQLTVTKIQLIFK